ncbi:unnamed protein product, partial [Mesorhabditis spiculigera]
MISPSVALLLLANAVPPIDSRLADDIIHCDNRWSYIGGKCYKLLTWTSGWDPTVCANEYNSSLTSADDDPTEQYIDDFDEMLRNYYVYCAGDEDNSKEVIINLNNAGEFQPAKKTVVCPKGDLETKMQMSLCEIDLKRVRVDLSTDELRVALRNEPSFARIRMMTIELAFREQLQYICYYVLAFLTLTAGGTAYFFYRNWQNSRYLIRVQRELKRAMENVVQNVQLVEINEENRRGCFESGLGLDFEKLRDEWKADLTIVEQQFAETGSTLSTSGSATEPVKKPS